MAYTLRPYQEKAVDAAVSFLKKPVRHNAIEVLPTGSGKSLIIANIVANLNAPVLVFQPSKEILEQNLSKLEAYGYRGAVYSASKGRQEVGNITFATIGSVVNKSDLFTLFPYIIVDECHGVNAKEGMYKTFLGELEKSGAKILGLTATPYRLASNSFGTELRFLTRTRPKVFDEMIYFVQNRELFDGGYLARMEYAAGNGFDRNRLQVNSTGADYTDESVRRYFRSLNFQDKLVMAIEREMETRKNVLVFTRFIQESEYLIRNIPGSAIVTGETKKKERERLIGGFK
ncbi:MAG: DEAD/DEAH box helicase family protein, partial [Candidatus Omnitrophica bacterium]|nr:DEAD/DEAH box helicase family protein [Candidatus Omnitrophota bacterium]